MNLETDDIAPSGNRWRWVLLGLLPGVASDLMFATWRLTISSDADLIVALSTGLLYGAALLPFVAPFYLIEVGRRYVRAAHGGYQSVTPFVLMYGAANLVLWFAGVLLVLFAIGSR